MAFTLRCHDLQLRFRLIFSLHFDIIFANVDRILIYLSVLCTLGDALVAHLHSRAKKPTDQTHIPFTCYSYTQDTHFDGT